MGAAHVADATSRAENRRTIAALAVLIAAFAALRLALADYSLWYDEYASLIFADQPLSRLWSGWMVRETNPPLFYSLLKGWEAAFGSSLLVLRALPVLAGGIGLGLFAAIAWQGYGRRAAIPVVAIVGISAAHIWTSQLVRAYIFAMDGVLLSLLGLVLLLRTPSRPGPGLALYAAGAVIAIYSHTTMLLWPAIATLAWLVMDIPNLRAGRWRNAALLIAANLAVAAAAGWWIAITLSQLEGKTGNLGWLKPLSFGEYRYVVSQTILLTFQTGESQRWIHYSIIFAFLMATGLTVREVSTRFFLLLLGLGLAIVWLVEPVHPIASDKTVRWLMIFPALVIAGGAAHLASLWIRTGAVAVVGSLLAINLAASLAKFPLQDWKDRLPATDPGGTVLLVQHESMAEVATKACEIEFQSAECPLQIVALASADPSNAWAKGLYGKPLIEGRALEPALAETARIYTARLGGAYDPLLQLGRVPASARTQWGIPTIEGPFTPAQILGREPMPAR
jgi:hypothetical protein